MKLYLTRVSGNKKTGPIPVSTTSRDSCPSTCRLLGAGCYAENFPLVSHWNKVDQRGMDAAIFLKEIKRLPKGQLWRHNQAGDMPSEDGIMDSTFLYSLISANKRKKGFTYTHHLLNPTNVNLIHYSNKNGFTINASTDNVTDGIAAYRMGLPTVTILPLDAPNEQIVDGVKIVACPAEKSKRVQCSNCALCQIPDREYIIGFRAHGTRARTVDLIARDN